MRTHSHVIRFIPQVAVHSRIYIYLVICTVHKNTFTHYKVYATSGSVQQEQAEAGEGILTIQRDLTSRVDQN